MGFTIAEREMEVALRRMLQEMFPQVRLSRTGIAMLAAEIEALERKCGMMRCPRMRVGDRRPELN
jgi:hypothetical protein